MNSVLRKKIPLVLLVCIFLSIFFYASSIKYLYNAAFGHFSLMSARIKIDNNYLNEKISLSDKQKLSLALEIRDFASVELGLPKNESYKFFSEINRSYVGWNVYAAPKLSLKPHQWCFFVAGCVVYKGFFSKNDAILYAENLKKQYDYDVIVTPFNAYSTLGYFDDPILSSHLTFDKYRLASLVIHELAHQKLYISGNSRVNEAFATVVEREGLRRWFRKNNLTAEEKEMQRQWDEEDFKISEILKIRSRLDGIYLQDSPPAQKEIAKQALLKELTVKLCDSDCMRTYLPKAPEGLSEFNNAYFIPIDTYYGEFNELNQMLKDVNSNLDLFYLSVASRYRKH